MFSRAGEGRVFKNILRHRYIFEKTGQKRHSWIVFGKKMRFIGARSPSKLVYIGALGAYS